MRRGLAGLAAVLLLAPTPAFVQDIPGLPPTNLYLLSPNPQNGFLTFLVGDPAGGNGQPIGATRIRDARIDLVYTSPLLALPSAGRATIEVRTNCVGFGTSNLAVTFYDKHDVAISNPPAGVQPYPATLSDTLRGFICEPEPMRPPGSVVTIMNGATVVDTEKMLAGWGAGKPHP